MKTSWGIDFNENNTKFILKKFIDGKINEQYRPCSKDEAIIWFIQAINGSQPSPHPLNLLTQSD
jgi:hypothetical protein